MLILVTGASGFVGQNVCKYLKRHSYEVVTTSRHFYAGNHYICDLTKEDYVKQLFKNLYPDVIVHLASNPLPKLPEFHPDTVIDDNIKSTFNLLHWCPKPVRFINASSIVVYGNNLDLEVPTEKTIPQPTTVYAATKLASENLVNVYTKQFDMNGVNLRFPAIVGEGLTHGAVKAFIDKVRKDTVLRCLGNKPGATKPYLHIDDACSAIDLMLNKRFIGTFNVVPDEPIINIEEVAQAVMEAMDNVMPIEWLGEDKIWPGDINLLRACNSKIKGVGWRPKYNSREAIVQAVKDICR